MKAPDRSANRALLVVGGLLLADRVLGIFSPANPYADAPPGRPIDVGPTLTDLNMKAIADGLEVLLYGGIFEDEQAVIEAFDPAANDADVAGIIRAFGTRCAWFGLIQCMTLPGALAHYLSPGDRAELNAQLSSRGITIQF